MLAVTRIGGQSFLYVAAAQGAGYTARQVSVKLGEPVGNLYPVLGGLNVGDRVILSGIQFLQEGVPVQSHRQRRGPRRNQGIDGHESLPFAATGKVEILG